MRGEKFIGVAVAIAGIGCAELAIVAPAVRIDASGTRHVSASSDEAGERESWSWGVGAAITGSFDLPVAIAPEREPPARIAARSAAPCRTPALCLWEQRARAEALARVTLGIEGSAR